MDIKPIRTRRVLSALMSKAPAAAVVAWLDHQSAESIWITSVTLFEARLGLALLPDGKRRTALVAAFARLLEEDLENRVLDFDTAAATEAAELAAQRQKAGRPVDIRDTQIAGIALARRATLATRNARHFADHDKSDRSVAGFRALGRDFRMWGRILTPPSMQRLI